MCQRKYQTTIFWQLSKKQAESNIPIPSVSLTSLDVFIVVSFITLNKVNCTGSESMTVFILFLEPVQLHAKYLTESHLKQHIILPCVSMEFGPFPP